MTRKETITELKNYFTIDELVCDHCFPVWGERAWQFLDTELLETILILRRYIFKVGMTVNTSTQHQRGLRCNLCQIVRDKTEANDLYLSSHVNGAGIDTDVKNMTAQQARDKIVENSELLPYPIRLEAKVNWVHLDIYDMDNGRKVTFFNS